jgi:hypothetical protein
LLVSRARWAIAAGLLAALAAGALVVANTDTGAVVTPPESCATEMNDRGELLRRIEPPPAEPPAVALSTNESSGPGEPHQLLGTLYRAEWLRNGELWSVPISAQVDWGMALETSSAAAVTLAVATTSTPSLLTVYGFTSDSHGNGEPAGPPKYAIDCNRDDLVHATPQCRLNRVGERLQLPLVDLPPEVVRIAVSIAWLETGSTRDGQRVLYDTGTWLFSLKKH